MSEYDIEYYYLSDSEMRSEFDSEQDEENKRFKATEEDSNGYEAKCGDIFVSNSGKYTFVCEFCGGRYEDMGSFGDHLKDAHLDYDGEDSSTVGSGTELKVGDGHPDESGDTNSNKILEEGWQSNDHNLIETPTSADSELVEAPTPADSKLIETLTPADMGLYCKLCNRQFKRKLTFSRHRCPHKYKLITDNLTAKVLKDSPISANSPIEEVSTQFPVKDFATKVLTDTGKNQIEVDQFFCSLCSRYFTTKLKLTDHAASRHGNKIPVALRDDPSYLSCKFCHMKFDKVLERVDHEKTHDEEKPFRCALCPKTFRRKSERTYHDHSHTGARPYPCPHCPKAFASQINRLQHIRGHLGIKRFSCEFCDMKFVTNVQRNIHIRIHTHEKPYQCEECGERFRVSGKLFSHRKRHANIRDCKCDICGKSFFSNADVKKHRVGHFEDRPFECTECGKKFQRRKTLTAHQKLHGPEKSYECNICGKKFAQAAGLCTHRKTHGVVELNS